MKRLFTLVVFVSASFLAGAQKITSNNPVTNDPEAKKILDAVSAKFKTYKALQATFTYVIESAKGEKVASEKGTVSMEGTKYRVSIRGMEIFSDGRTSWNLDRSANEVTVKDADGSGAEMSPQKLFTNFYDKDFLYKLNGEKKLGGKTVQEIELTPNNKTRPYHKVYVWIDKATKTMYSAKILEKNGNRYSYTINNFKPVTDIADAEFVFDKKKYPGVEVVDLR